MTITYDQARKDHEYLWEYGAAQDMSGAYVDQEDLERLLKSPTKGTARDCYEKQILFWFQIGPDSFGNSMDWRTDPEVRKIAERHDTEIDLDNLISKGE